MALTLNFPIILFNSKSEFVTFDLEIFSAYVLERSARYHFPFSSLTTVLLFKSQKHISILVIYFYCQQRLLRKINRHYNYFENKFVNQNKKVSLSCSCIFSLCMCMLLTQNCIAWFDNAFTPLENQCFF